MTLSFWWYCFLIAILCMGFGGFWAFAEQYAYTPQETGILVLSSLSVKEGTIRIRIPSGGCTTKDDIVAEISPTGETSHYVVTFFRKVPDPCSEVLPEGEEFVFDLVEDLHLEAYSHLSVRNPVMPFGNLEEFGLRRDLIKATIFAIASEIKRYTESEHKDREEKIAFLKEELERFQKMHPAEYRLSGEEEVVHLGTFGVLMPPEIREVEILAPPRALGDILEVAGMTRSGPFYHVAGVRGGDLSVFAPSRHYKATIYLVYRREYFGFIPNYYVYVADWEEIP